jgi:hypothetical protein
MGVWRCRSLSRSRTASLQAILTALSTSSGASVGGVAAAHAAIYVRDCSSGSGCTITTEQGAWRLT